MADDPTPARPRKRAEPPAPPPPDRKQRPRKAGPGMPVFLPPSEADPAPPPRVPGVRRPPPAFGAQESEETGTTPADTPQRGPARPSRSTPTAEPTPQGAIPSRRRPAPPAFAAPDTDPPTPAKKAPVRKVTPTHTQDQLPVPEPTPAKATPAKSTPPKATPAKATPAKAAPAREPAKKTASATAAPTTPPPAKKATTKKAPPPTTTEPPTPAKKSTAEKTPAKKTQAKKAATKKTAEAAPPPDAPAKKAPAQKAAAKKAPAKKATAKKATAPAKATTTPEDLPKATKSTTAPAKVAKALIKKAAAKKAPTKATHPTEPVVPPTPAEPAAPTVLSGEILPAQPKPVPASNSDLAPTAPSLRDFRDRPMQAAELLALAAVAHYGPGAATNVGWLREQYPNASGEGVARAAAHRFVRQARNRGAMAGLAGPLAVLLDAGTLHALHADLILHIAAAHGADPTAPERAAELLYLLGVHDSAAEASTAVSSAIEPSGGGAAGDPTRLTRPLARTLTLGVLRVGARRVLRLIPGAGAVIGAIANARATDEMVTRALRFYRKRG